MRILCIGLDKVAAIADMLQHECKDLRLLGLMFDNVKSVFLVCEIERIVRGNK